VPVPDPLVPPPVESEPLESDAGSPPSFEGPGLTIGEVGEDDTVGVVSPTLPEPLSDPLPSITTGLGEVGEGDTVGVDTLSWVGLPTVLLFAPVDSPSTLEGLAVGDGWDGKAVGVESSS
jgi:hypothetical protein